jgi:hypothetical protein
MEADFFIKLSSDGINYYIGSNIVSSDGYIAYLLSMDVIEYKIFLIENFNGHNNNIFGEIYFLVKEDAENALAWVESMFVCNKLMNKNFKESRI